MNAEIPKLINFLIAYMNAGLHPVQALEYASQNLSFSEALRFPLFKVTTLCTRGCTFVDSIEIVLKDIMGKPTFKYLSLLLIGLKVSFLQGAGSVYILEKIANKANDEIKFQQKLRVITAQMRLQANVILFSPLCLTILMLFVSPEHIFVFFESIFGICLFVIMIIFNFCGYFTIQKIVKIL